MRTKSIFIIASIALASMLTLSSCSTKTRAINQLENPKRIKAVKKDIARILTVQNESAADA